MKTDSVFHDHMAELGELALVSRLRRLSDALWLDTATLYAELGFDFQPRWFAVFSAIERAGQPSISELAGMVGLTTQGVGKIANELLDAGLIREVSNRTDARMRRISLSRRGRSSYDLLKPVWRGVRSIASELMAEAGVDLVADLDHIEAALARTSLIARLREHFDLPALPDLEIVDYRPAYKKHFRALNEQWLSAQFEIEPHDAQLLADPNGRIIKRDGHILFAVVRAHVVGTCALIRHPSGAFELTKMAVTPQYRNRGIGTRLAAAAVARALDSGVETVYLRSHPELVAAHRVFRYVGFRRVTKSPLSPPKVDREAITMRLNANAYQEYVTQQEDD